MRILLLIVAAVLFAEPAAIAGDGGSCARPPFNACHYPTEPGDGIFYCADGAEGWGAG